MPFAVQKLSNNFADWDVTYDIYSDLRGSCKFTNQNRQYDASTVRWQPFSLALDVTLDSDLANSSCFDGDVTWFAGLIKSFEDIREIDKDTITAHLSSYFTTLRSHPINTQYYTDTVGNIILDILNVYAGVPLALLNFSMAATPSVSTVVQGNDLLDQCEKLAQAGESDIFEQVGGILTVEAWKDELSTIDHSLPQEAIIKVSKNRGKEKGPSRLTIRGSWTGSYGCGPKIINNSKNNEPGQITRDKCYVPGVNETLSSMSFKNLSASKKDLKNAGYVLTGDTSFEKVDFISEQGGEADVLVRDSGGAYLTAAEEAVTNAKIFGRNLGEEENNDPGSKSNGTKDKLTQHDRVLGMITGTPPGTFRGATADNDKTADSDDNNRLNLTLSDGDLISEYGVVTGEIDNPYIGTGYTAIAVAIREFKKFKMQRNTYVVDTAYLPCIEMNDVISFPDPRNKATITGRVVQITVKFTPNPYKVTMQLRVESFEELGGTLYVTDNLFKYPTCCGINGVDWIISSTDVYAISGYFAFENGGELYQPIYLATGFIYTVSVDLTLNSGPGSFEIRNYNGGVLGGTSLALTASGTLTHNFSPTVSDVWVEFAATSGTWFATNPKIITSITA